MGRFLCASAAFAAVFVLTAILAHAADPAVSCESLKLKASGKYASCLLGADAKAVKKALSPDYSKCDLKIDKLWPKAETKGAGLCPGGTGDQTDVQTFLYDCRDSVANVLAGGAPAGLFTCSNDLASCLSSCPVTAYVRTGETTCYDSYGSVIACAGTGQDGELQKGVVRSFTDNGDGTITDNATKLMWEKLSGDGSIHDMNNTYTWANAFATKVATLNSASFAGHTDWRVPSVNELQTLVNYGTYNPATYAAFNTGCAPGCTVTTCSCNVSSGYWSSTSFADYPTYAWIVVFYDGGVSTYGKTYNYNGHVRAVRGGS